MTYQLFFQTKHNFLSLYETWLRVFIINGINSVFKNYVFVYVGVCVCTNLYIFDCMSVLLFILFSLFYLFLYVLF